MSVPSWVQASSGYFPNYDPPQYKPKIDPLKYQPPQLQPPDYEKVHWEKPDDQSKSWEETVQNSLDPNVPGGDDQTTSTWDALLNLIRKQEGGFFHEAMFVASAMIGALGVMGVKSATTSGGTSSKGIWGQLFRLGGLLTSGTSMLHGAWSLWSSNKGKVTAGALAILVLSGAGVYWYQQQFTQEPINGYDAIAAKERYQYYLLSKMEDSATYIKIRYGDQPRGYYTDEQGILRDANGAIAWDFIGQYQERNPALFEKLIYPTMEHGERVEYWGKKVAE
ncbi:hypothetical protein [Brevibacillus migulae]|uniref:hypothetical protein n=1 Tax=Brevibacillus migulae TaxID=1644114 RepID=UPI00106E2BA3|nr:hypothetical protein [Brevibacillus migulae]